MAVPVQCDQCQAKYLIEDRFAGKRAKCKRCGHVMSIPMPAGPGGSPALSSDDTGGTGEIGMMDSPFGTPGPRGSSQAPQGVTSQVPRSWRPQDVVVEREDDVTEVPLAYDGRPVRITSLPTGRTYDALVPLLLILYVAVVVYLGWSGQSRVEAKYPPEVVSAAGGWLKAYIWGQAGFMVVGLFAIAGPLILAGLAGGLKIRNLRLPGSAYLKACALAAIPSALLAYAIIATNSEGSDGSLFAGALLLAAVGGFFAVRFIIGLDWVSSAICFAFAAILGTIGAQISARAAAGAADAMFTPSIQREIAKAQTATSKSRLARATRNDVATASSPTVASIPTPTPTLPSVPAAPTPAVTPDPMPAPAAPTPAPATPQRPASTLFDDDGLGAAPPAPSTPAPNTPAPNTPVPNTPAPVAVAPAVARPNVPIRVNTSKGEPEERDTLIETALQDMKLRVKSAAGEAVTDVSAVALKPDVIAVVRPPGPSSTFAAVRRAEGAKEDHVEIYTGNPPAKVATADVAFEVPAVPNYAVSADGERLARVAEFPRLALRVTSAADGKEVAAVDLDSKFGSPTLLGFLTADRVLVRWEKEGQFGLEVEDLRTRRHGRQISLPDYDAAACSNAISPDGRYFATAVRSAGKPVAVVVYSLFDGSRKQLVVKSLDPKWAIRPAGLAFSTDSNKLAALFVQSGAAVIAAWNPKSGATLPDLTVSTAVQPLQPLPNSGEAGGANAGGGGPGAASANSLNWLGNGSALLACGSALIGATNGSGIADLGALDSFGQSVVSENAVRVWYRDAQRPAGVLTITFDPKALPGGRAAPAASPKR